MRSYHEIPGGVNFKNSMLYTVLRFVSIVIFPFFVYLLVEDLDVCSAKMVMAHHQQMFFMLLHDAIFTFIIFISLLWAETLCCHHEVPDG